MKCKQFEVWIADLNPQIGTEPGKVRPVLVVQTNLLNPVHPATLVCPITTNVKAGAELLRVNLRKGEAGLNENCAVMIDQLRAIDNKRLVKKIGELPGLYQKRVKENIKVVLDLE